MNIYERHMKRIRGCVPLATMEDAFFIMLDRAKADGTVLPFDSMEGYRNWVEFYRQEAIRETQRREHVQKKMGKLECSRGFYAKNTFRAEVAEFVNRHGYSAEKAFESMQRIKPGIFNSREEFNEFIKKIAEANSAQ